MSTLAPLETATSRGIVICRYRAQIDSCVVGCNRLGGACVSCHPIDVASHSNSARLWSRCIFAWTGEGQHVAISVCHTMLSWLENQRLSLHWWVFLLVVCYFLMCICQMFTAGRKHVYRWQRTGITPLQLQQRTRVILICDYNRYTATPPMHVGFLLLFRMSQLEN